jgi:predicted enzyme related to lactoylglutathione lyase
VAGGEERPQAAGPVLAMKVVDLESAVDRLISSGGMVIAEAKEGPHERRVEAKDRFGTALLLYQPLSEPK